MRIAINGLTLTSRRTGIGRVTLHTLRALLASDTDDEFVVLLPSDAAPDLGLEAPNLEAIGTGVSLSEPLKSTVFEETGIPNLLRDRGIDLYYAPSFLLPLWPAAEREVICVHDLAWRRHPDSKSLQFRTYMNLRLPAALRRASRVVCVSEATRRDLLGESWPLDAAKLRVVHNGVDHARFDHSREPVDPPYAAVVGNMDQRKNLRFLLAAIEKLRERHPRFRLKVVGPGTPPVQAEGVDFLGYRDDADLAAIYAGARFVAQPSVYEGFGLPVLEAMAAGAPVACSDIPVFREVAGDAARYFPPDDRAAAVALMDALLTDDALCAELSRQGRERAQRFSWTRTANDLKSVFDEVAP